MALVCIFGCMIPVLRLEEDIPLATGFKTHDNLPRIL
jgi:hypothetical protein